MSLLGYGTIKVGLYYQIMIDCLAIRWMCQGYTLQEDHVWWPAGAKLHGEVFHYVGNGFWVKLHWTFWKCLIFTTCLVSKMSEMVWLMSVRHAWIQNVKRNWDGKPRDCQLREGSPHSSLMKEYCLDKWRLNRCSLVLHTKWTMAWAHPPFY